MFNLNKQQKAMTANVSLPKHILAFVKAVTTPPVKNFPPIFDCEDVRIEEVNPDEWLIDFLGKQSPEKIKMALAWMPLTHKFQGLGLFDNMMSMTISPNGR